MGILTRLWEGIRRGIGLLLPFFAQAIDFRGVARHLIAVLRFVLLIVVLVVLYFINVYTLSKNKLLENTPFAFLQDFWLPILFLLLVAISWLVWWIYKTVTEPEVSRFPDIDRDWTEAMQALYRNGIDPTNVPLFLVFGRAGDSEEHLFSASQFSFDVMKTPSRGDASVRVYGSHKAVFVTCPGASLLAKHTENLKEPAAQNDFSPEGEKTNVSDDLDKTMNPDLLTGPTQEIKEIVVRAKSENRDLTEDEHKQIQNLIAQDKVRNTAAKGKPRPSLLKDNPEVERLTERLEHTCRLIIQERHPYCPINGILVTLPAAGTETDEEANQTGRICQRELNAAQDILQVNCPLFTLVCDMDGVPGFAAFVKRFTPDQRKQRVGSRFRMRPDPSLSAAEMESWAEKLAQHICHSVIPSFIYKFFRMERTGIDSMETVVKENVALYHLMRQMHERQKRLARILALGIAQETNGPALWGGCYIAGTGKDAETQAFAHGVFNRLVENQDYISWTKEASTQEWNYLRWTRLGYIGLAAYAAVLVLAIFLVRKLFS